MLIGKVSLVTIWIVLLVSWSLPALAEMVVDTAWIRIYNGSGDSDDWANAIALDDSGNVYVTGWSLGVETSYDYATIKYYSGGDTAWVRRYNGFGNGHDVANAIAADQSGNVYVTGTSHGSDTYYDYATIKYHIDGDTAWVRRYDGPGSSHDYANAMVVDASGNVYVTGDSYDEVTRDDYVTIKYYPNGDTAWVRRYNGTGNHHDHATALGVDGLGNVFVTGSSRGEDLGYDFLTIKYCPNGDTAWVRRFDGPDNSASWADAIALDDSGNVYVTGGSAGAETGEDYMTVRYYSNGDTAWTRRYNGPGDSSDWPFAIATDDSGDIFVSGCSYDDPTYLDYATVKYEQEGTQAWVARYDGPASGFDSVCAIAVDPCGDVYVAGLSDGGATSYDYALVKYYSNGETAWVKRHDGLGSGVDVATAMTVDNSGNVYVAGYSQGNGARGNSVNFGTNFDYVTIKYVQVLRGDATGNGVIEIGDVVYLINYLYRNGSPPEPLSVGDCTCDGTVDVGDVVYLIDYLYRGGDSPNCP